MKAFITGSRAYGTPRTTSDVDLVVLVTAEELDVLEEMGYAHPNNSGTLMGNLSLQFGRMNLIVLTDPSDYSVWLEATTRLIERKPVIRREAVELFDRLLHKRNSGDDVQKLKIHRELSMGVQVSLLRLVSVAGTRGLWPADFEGKISKIEEDTNEKTAWGVTADWLDENDEPVLADAFRWVCNRKTLSVKKYGGSFTAEWRAEGLPHAVAAHYSVFGYNTSTLPGLAAAIAGALKKVREDAA